MAEHALDFRRKLAKGAVILDDFEQGIVAEATRASRFKANSAAAATFACGPRQAGRIGHGQAAHVMGGATLQRRRTELFQQADIVPLVGGTRAGIAGRVDARRASQGVDLDAAVLSQHPGAQMPRLLRGLERGVGGKRLAGLLDFRACGVIGQRPQRQVERREQLGQLDHLMAIRVPSTRTRFERHGRTCNGQATQLGASLRPL